MSTVNPYEAPRLVDDIESENGGQRSPQHRSFQLTPPTPESVGTLREALGFAISESLIFVLISSMTLATGGFSRVVPLAAVVFWGLVAWMLVRRRSHLTLVDIALIKHGFLLVFVVTGILSSLLGRV